MNVKSLYVQSDNVFPLPLAKRILLHVLRGIAHAHRSGVAHTNLKQDDIFFFLLECPPPKSRSSLLLNLPVLVTTASSPALAAHMLWPTLEITAYPPCARNFHWWTVEPKGGHINTRMPATFYLFGRFHNATQLELVTGRGFQMRALSRVEI